MQNELFVSRKEEALADARQATSAAQETLDDAAVQTGDSVQLQTLMNSVLAILVQQSSTDMIAAARIDRTAPQAPQDFTIGGFDKAIITDGMRLAVRSSAEPQWWQSVALPAQDGGTMPGILVGQQLVLPEVGAYELYFAYDLGSAAGTLGFIQFTLWVVGNRARPPHRRHRMVRAAVGHDAHQRGGARPANGSPPGS